MAGKFAVAQDVVLSLIIAACPERAVELKDFFARFRPTFSLRQDGVGTAISARGSEVSWAHKAFAHAWVVACAGFKAQAAYGPHVLLGAALGRGISLQTLRDDEGLELAQSELETVLYAAKQIVVAATLEDLDWPPEVPRPVASRDELNTVEEQACFEIACMAAAATFLHELRHVQFTAEKNAPAAPADEERACDDFCRAMLLDNVDVYCAGTGEPVEQVASKRIIGLASAALTIAQAELHNMASSIQSTHPPIRDRFKHLALNATMSGDATCWSYTASLLIAQLRGEGRLPQEVQFSSPRQLCEQLVAAL
jgi:hypothetical protein